MVMVMIADKTFGNAYCLRDVSIIFSTKSDL